jgi:hypothetical protein
MLVGRGAEHARTLAAPCVSARALLVKQSVGALRRTELGLSL